jgi:excisionase family DNA binding protein
VQEKKLVAGGLVSVARACAFLGVSRSTLYNLMTTQQLAYVKIGKARRVPRRALIALANAGLVGV